MRSTDAELLLPGNIIAALTDPNHARTSPLVWVQIVDPKLVWPGGGGGGTYLTARPADPDLTLADCPGVFTRHAGQGSTAVGLVATARLDPRRGFHRTAQHWQIAQAEEARHTEAAVRWYAQHHEWRKSAVRVLTEQIGAREVEIENRDTVRVAISDHLQLQLLLETLSPTFEGSELEVLIPIKLLVGPMPTAPSKKATRTAS